ncbi:MAG: SpoIID/LytB domain-containing protein [Oscillospiraceae bacterium]
MTLPHNRFLARLLFRAALFIALAALFRCVAPTEANASFDSSTTIRVLMPDGEVQAMTLAEYLPGAVAAEMPVSFGEEALKAQAVAARSYVLATHSHDNADICTDSACCLAWHEPDADEAPAEAAVRATDGQVVTYNGRIVQAVFHASSYGATEDAAAVWSAQPYLVSVSSPETADNVPGLLSEAVFSPDELREKLGLTPEGEPDTWLIGTVTDEAGRVAFLRIGGQALSGTFVRSALGLRSTDFDVSYDGADFVFSVAGHGHGVGMSQYGAKLLAAQGLSYAEILAHYYPGTVLDHA